MDISIIHEDKSLIVINKPAGIIVNRSDTTSNVETLQDWAEQYLNIQKVEREEGVSAFFERGGIVHRLDKETSGILLIAKNPVSFADLQDQFKKRVVHKAYLALTHGLVTPQSGEIQAPVDRLPWNRKRFGVIPGGKASVTKYSTLKHFTFLSGSYKDKPLTLLELFPETGRTHQIRVHLKHIGYPIFSDFLYAGRKTSRDDRKFLSRVFLHASGISYADPITHKTVSFKSPMPEDLENFISENLIELEINS